MHRRNRNESGSERWNGNFLDNLVVVNPELRAYCFDRTKSKSISDKAARACVDKRDTRPKYYIFGRTVPHLGSSAAVTRDSVTTHTLGYEGPSTASAVLVHKLSIIHDVRHGHLLFSVSLCEISSHRQVIDFYTRLSCQESPTPVMLKEDNAAIRASKQDPVQGIRIRVREQYPLPDLPASERDLPSLRRSFVGPLATFAPGGNAGTRIGSGSGAGSLPTATITWLSGPMCPPSPVRPWSP